MNKKLLYVIGLLLITGFNTVKSQEENTNDDNAPVSDAFTCSMLIENQTVASPSKKGKEIIIHHRMGVIKSIDDLFGIYGPSNIRLGFNYGINDRLMAGFGTERISKMQELIWKYAIIRQKKKGMPVFVSYFGNAVIDARDKKFFGEGFKFADRLSFFHQLIIARKFTDRVSVQTSAGFLHFNKVDSTLANQMMVAGISGRVMIWNDISFIAEYSQPVFLETMANKPRPNLSFGFEKYTGTHSFQLFASTANNIISQKIHLLNQRDFTKAEFVVGFNITVRI